jgi:uncharacterized protein (DUF1778 family)
MRTNSNYALRLPASLKKEVEKVAADDGSTLNQFIVSAVAEKLSALKTEEYFAIRAARADVAKFDKLMSRTGGQLPQAGDELPDGYKRRIK